MQVHAIDARPCDTDIGKPNGKGLIYLSGSAVFSRLPEKTVKHA